MNIFAYGGSIINPDGNYSIPAMEEIRKIVKDFPEDKFLFVIGGGKICRNIQSSCENILQNSLNSDLVSYGKDWLGIAASRMNAETVRHFISKSVQGVHNEILLDPRYEQLPESSRIFFSGGWKPGWSTDYVSLLFAQSFGESKVFKISNFERVLDVKSIDFDKSKLDSYQPLSNLSWDKMIELVGTKWIPGANAPLDPAAAQLGKKLSNNGFKLYIGPKAQIYNMIKDRDFAGSLVE